MIRYSAKLGTTVTTETRPMPDGYTMRINRYGDKRTPQVFFDGKTSIVRYWSEEKIEKFLKEVQGKK